MSDKDWMRMAEHFDDIHPNSIKRLENLIYNQERKKEFLQALNISDINVPQFENKEPVPAEQKAKADTIIADIRQAFEKSGLAGISFQVVPPGRMPEYNVNPSFFQGDGWQKSDQYTVAFMFPGVNKQKFFGDGALKSLMENGIDVSKEYQAVKEKHSEIRLATVFDDGFPA